MRYAKVFSFFTLVCFSLFAILPIINVISTSLRADNAFATRSLEIIPKHASALNYLKVLRDTDFLIWLTNSFWISGAVTVVGVSVAATSGYALSRFNFKGKRWFLGALLVTQMFPAAMFLLPFFIVLSHLKLIDSFWGLLVIYSSSALPFCIWQMKGYFDTIPRELEEAARIDGCSSWTTFYKIILPLAAPALAITSIFNFMTAWSEYMVAAVILQDPQLYTLPLGLKSFQSSMATQWGLYAAAAIMVSFPVVILFLVFMRYMVSGLTLGSVKG